MFWNKKVNTYKSDITFPVWYVMYAVFACYTMLAVREDHALYGAVLLTVRVNSMKKICFKNWNNSLGKDRLKIVKFEPLGPSTFGFQPNFQNRQLSQTFHFKPFWVVQFHVWPSTLVPLQRPLWPTTLLSTKIPDIALSSGIHSLKSSSFYCTLRYARIRVQLAAWTWKYCTDICCNTRCRSI